MKQRPKKKFIKTAKINSDIKPENKFASYNCDNEIKESQLIFSAKYKRQIKDLAIRLQKKLQNSTGKVLENSENEDCEE